MPSSGRPCSECMIASAFWTRVPNGTKRSRRHCGVRRHCRVRRSRRLDVEQEVHDVAVLDDVLLAFHAQLAGRLDRGLAAELLEVRERVDLGADEAFLE